MHRIGQNPYKLLLAGDLAVIICNLHLARPTQLVLVQTQVQIRLHGLGRAVEEPQGERLRVNGGGLERDVEGGVEADGDGFGRRVEQLSRIHCERCVVEDSL